MKDEKIKESLDKLRKALNELDPKDEASRKKLSKVIHEVDGRLSGKHERDLENELNKAVVHFKVEHPVITELINEIKMALYSLGL